MFFKLCITCSYLVNDPSMKARHMTLCLRPPLVTYIGNGNSKGSLKCLGDQCDMLLVHFTQDLCNFQGSAQSFQTGRSFVTFSGFRGEVLIQILDFPICSIHLGLK